MAAPGGGEVLVRTVASSVNPVDDKTREGVFPGIALPATLGWDLAGIVVGGVGFEVGQRVVAMSHQLSSGVGTWAEVVALPARAVAPAPSSVSLLDAATLPLAGLTAWQTLDWLGVAAGERVLVAGGAGAVGALAVQLARARGAVVDALVSRAGHVELVRGFGAEVVATEAGGLRRYDAVFDTFGAFATEAVVDGGRYASVASQARPVPDLSHRGVRTTVNQVREDGDALRRLAALVDDGLLRTRVDSVYGVQDVRAAHERFRRGRLDGKVVLAF
ncbi:NADP-dependent oxidoreductase [Crossiella equi]|uniref:NADP-dependent oxidoreductase n=1 Tax=Crossiella equi TaxID=130796 RepID=UPI003556A151